MAHVTRIEPVGEQFRWVCSCGAASPITFTARAAALRAAWAHRTAAAL